MDVDEVAKSKRRWSGDIDCPRVRCRTRIEMADSVHRKHLEVMAARSKRVVSYWARAGHEIAVETTEERATPFSRRELEGRAHTCSARRWISRNDCLRLGRINRPVIVCRCWVCC